MYRKGDIVRIKENFRELVRNENEHPGTNYQMYGLAGKPFFVLSHRKDNGVDILKLSTRTSCDTNYFWREEWVEETTVTEVFSEGDVLGFVEAYIHTFENEHPFILSEMKSYASAYLKHKNVILEKMYEKELNGKIVYLYKLKDHPFLWPSALFYKSEE